MPRAPSGPWTVPAAMPCGSMKCWPGAGSAARSCMAITWPSAMSRATCTGSAPRTAASWPAPGWTRRRSAAPRRCPRPPACCSPSAARAGWRPTACSNWSSRPGRGPAAQAGEAIVLPLVALVGRPNVGKSTLFNVLTRSRDALVHDEPGVTRDRQYGICRLAESRPFVVCDTGGLSGDEAGLAGATARQARAAVEEADLTLFVVDGREGPSAMDDAILAWLRRSGRPFLLVVNKVDGLDLGAALAEFASFGLEQALPVAAAHRRGIDELMAEVLARLPEDGDAQVLAD